MEGFGNKGEKEVITKTNFYYKLGDIICKATF